MAECAYCGREVDRIPANKFTFYNPVLHVWQGFYVCDSCRRAYLVTGAQVGEVLSKWRETRVEVDE